MTTNVIKRNFWRSNLLLSIFTLGVAVLMGIWIGMSHSVPTDDKLKLENDQLQRYVRQLQQQLTVMSAKSTDLETLQKVQEQVIEELRGGNRELQDNIYKLEKDMQVYRNLGKKK